MKLDLDSQKILVVGAGREGIAMVQFLIEQYPAVDVAIADAKQIGLPVELKNAKTFFGETYLERVKDYDLIIKSPGIPLSVIPGGTRLTSPTQIFFDLCQGMVIGVTGTKGKSTTTSLIYQILKDAGVDCEIVGNIGKPAIEFLKTDKKSKTYVFELSSFQLETLTKSPHIAVFLNIFEDHLDIHGDFQHYLEAKLNIARFQNEQDYLVYNQNFEEFLKPVSKAISVPFDPKDEKEVAAIMDLGDIPLVGGFNIANVHAAMSVARIFKIPNASIAKSIKSFRPLKHRLQNIGEHNGIIFYNDSIATNPSATEAAIGALGKNLHTLIVGGFDRGLDYSGLAQNIINNKVEVLILLPVTGQKIIEKILKIDPDYKQKYFFAHNMKEAVVLAYKHTPQGKICLLSPASASFNLFKNFEDRGEQFISEVNKLA